jgi:excisionase family DNA binding protein
MNSIRKELLTVDEVAEYLGVGPVTIYRWCREGRLPGIKVGKEWRIRRAALEDFLREAERCQSLVSRLRSFLEVPDHVIAIAETEALEHRLDAAFFQVGEAHGGMLIKFYTGETMPVQELRAELTRNGLDVAKLEVAGRFLFVEEADPVDGRTRTLRRLLDEAISEGRSIWTSFNWVRQVDLDEALRQQNKLAQLIDTGHLVVITHVLERIVDEWPPASRRRAQHTHRGIITLSEGQLSLTRVVPLPST